MLSLSIEPLFNHIIGVGNMGIECAFMRSNGYAENDTTHLQEVLGRLQR